MATEILVGPKTKIFGKLGCVVYDAVGASLEASDATEVSVKFRDEAFAEIFAKLDSLGYEYLIMGWYHTHPGHTAFYSETDIATHKRNFSKPHQVGIVIDPLHEDVGVYGLHEEGYIEKAFLVVDDGELVEERFDIAEAEEEEEFDFGEDFEFSSEDEDMEFEVEEVEHDDFAEE